MKPQIDLSDQFAFSDRYFLIAGAVHHIASSYDVSWRDCPEVRYVAALHYLYGAEFIGVVGGKLEKTKKKDDEYIAWALLPTLTMFATSRPIMRHVGEPGIVKKYLTGRGYTHFQTYFTWPTPEGDQARKELAQIVKNVPLSEYKKAWDKKNEKLKKIALAWYRAYKKKYPKTKLKIWQKEERTVLYFPLTKKMKTPSALSVAQKKKLHAPYAKDIARYAEFLVEKFCAKDTLFQKCDFER